MALFKVLRGDESNLPSTKTDGWAYFCSDTGNFYIDHIDSSRTLMRTQINADCANKLRYLNGTEYIEISAEGVAAAIDRLDTHISNLSNYYNKEEIDNKIPAVTTSDNGKFLRVVDGVWTATSVPNAEEASF